MLCRNVLFMARAHTAEIVQVATFRRPIYPRPLRLYPQPPPPSKNNTKRTIKIVSIFHLSFFSGSWWTGLYKSSPASLPLSILGVAEEGVCAITTGCLDTNAQPISWNWTSMVEMMESECRTKNGYEGQAPDSELRSMNSRIRLRGGSQAWRELCYTLA